MSANDSVFKQYSSSLYAENYTVTDSLQFHTM
jgi:hypothetical protein